MNFNLTRLEKRFDLIRYLEQFEFKESGDNAVLECPHCGKADKLYVLMKDKRDTDGAVVPRGTWICYYCHDVEGGGAGRTCLSLIEWIEDLSFLDAAKRLADGGTSADADFIGAIEKLVASLEGEDEEDEPPPTVELPRAFKLIDEDHYPPYCAERGISVERAQRFRLGYCLKGYYANRLIAPVYFDSRCVGYQARWMEKKPRMCDEPTLPCTHCGGTDKHKRRKKTFHSKHAKMSRVLYNWSSASVCKRIVIVEDPWSAIHIGRSGTCAFGTHLSAAQLELLMKSDAREIVFMWDRDEDAAPGKGGYDKSLSFAYRLSQLVPVRAVRLPDERDPDEHSIKSLRKLIASTPVLSATDAFITRMKRRYAYL